MKFDVDGVISGLQIPFSTENDEIINSCIREWSHSTHDHTMNSSNGKFYRQMDESHNSKRTLSPQISVHGNKKHKKNMGTISANDMKLVADILAEITDEDVTTTPSGARSPPPLVAHPTVTRSNGTSLEETSSQNLTRVVSDPGQPGVNTSVRSSNDTGGATSPTTPYHSSSPAIIDEDAPSKIKASPCQRTTTRKRTQKADQNRQIFLCEVTRAMYRYLNDHGEANLTDDSFLMRLGNPDNRRVYDAVRWLEGFGLVEREKIKGTQLKEARTMIYLIFEDGSTLRSVQKEIDHLDQEIKSK